MTDDLPREIGGYTILERIGVGSSSTVYRAEKDGQLYALKLLHVPLVNDPRARRRLEQEARLMLDLDHPGLVRCHAFGLGDEVWLALDLVEGETLHDMIERDFGLTDLATDDATVVTGSIEHRQLIEGGSPGTSSLGSSIDTSHGNQLRWILRAFEEVARALHYLHGRGVLHRDVKPRNILIDRDGNAHLTDLGLARDETQSTMTMEGEFLGTPAYISPEQAMAGRVEVDARSDVYSLGASLYHCVTGHCPFQGRDHRETLRKVLVVEPPSVRTLNPNLSRDLQNVLAKVLEKDPARRYTTAEAFADDLRNLRNLGRVSARAPSLWSRGMKWVKRRPWTVAGSLVVLVMASAGAAVHEIRLSEITRDYRPLETRIIDGPIDGLTWEVLLDEDEDEDGSEGPFPISPSWWNGDLRVPAETALRVHLEGPSGRQTYLIRLEGKPPEEPPYVLFFPSRRPASPDSDWVRIPETTIPEVVTDRVVDGQAQRVVLWNQRTVAEFMVRAHPLTLGEIRQVYCALLERDEDELCSAILSGTFPYPNEVPDSDPSLPEKLNLEAALIVASYLGYRLPTDREWGAIEKQVEVPGADSRLRKLASILKRAPPEILVTTLRLSVGAQKDQHILRGPYRAGSQPARNSAIHQRGVKNPAEVLLILDP